MIIDGIKNKILLVDDEVSALKAMTRIFADVGVETLTATSGEEALACINEHEIAVLLTDNMMPGMSGIELLTKVKSISPDTVKMMMTGYAELDVAIQAINEAEVYKFLIKPCDNETILDHVCNGIERYTIVKSLRNSDERTLLSLAQAIELKDPYTRGHCQRVANYALLLADGLNLSEETKKHIKHGCWLHDCGKIGVPEAILNKTDPLLESEWDIIQKHPLWGAELARLAGLNKVIINIIQAHHERYDGNGYPDGIKGDSIPLATGIVSIADVYDALTSDRPYRKGFTKEKGLEVILELKGSYFKPELADFFVKKASENELAP